MIAIDISKQQELDADPKEKKHIYFNWNLNWNENTTMFFMLKKQKKPFQIFHKELSKDCECRCTTWLLGVPLFISLYHNINIKWTQYNILNVKLSNCNLIN